MDDNLVLLLRTSFPGEAEIVKSFLESQNISTALMDNVDVLNYIGFSGIRVMVAGQDLERAQMLLKDTDLQGESTL